MASDRGKEEMQPHMCILLHSLMCSMGLRTGRDFELSSALSLSHTKPSAMWAGKHVNRQMWVEPVRKTSHIPGEITLPMVSPHKKEIHYRRHLKEHMNRHLQGWWRKQVLFAVVLNQTDPDTLSRRNMIILSCTTAGTPRGCYSGDLSQTALCIPGKYLASINIPYYFPRSYFQAILHNICYKTLNVNWRKQFPYILMITCEHYPSLPPFLQQGSLPSFSPYNQGKAAPNAFLPAAIPEAISCQVAGWCSVPHTPHGSEQTTWCQLSSMSSAHYQSTVCLLCYRNQNCKINC